MAFNVNNLLIADVLSATMFSKDGTKVRFGLNDISEPSLELGGNMVYATDRHSTPFAAFAQEKTASFSGSNSTMSLDLLASQMGGQKNVASAKSKLSTPVKEIFSLADDGGALKKNITLKKTPVTGSIIIEVLDTAGTPMGVNIPIAAASSATAASVSESTITLPTGASLTADDRICVYYDYETENAVEATGTAESIVVSGRFQVEVMFADKCDQSKIYYGFLEFPSAVLKTEATLDLTNEGKHPFTVDAMAEYCSDGLTLFRVVVPES